MNAEHTRQRTSLDQPDAKSREHADARVKIKSRAQPDSTERREAPEPVNDRVTLKEVKTGEEPPENGARSPKEDAGNPTRPLDKPRVRRDAAEAQEILQEEGPDALPVSDYPLKKRPPAANPMDRSRSARR